MATPHLAAEPGDFAPLVLMPGDPRRARRIADDLLDDVRLVTDVRGILGFTGRHEGSPVSVLASGMGGPSLAVYATELARSYGVRRIVRVGTAGALQPGMPLGSVEAAERGQVPLRVGPVFSSDTFYADVPATETGLVRLGTLAIEMEAATLYAVGAREGIETLALLTVADDLTTGESLTAEDRETGFGAAARLALAAGLS